MITAKPEIPCVDFWPHGIPADKKRAYKAMIDAGQITRRHATVSTRTGAVVVEYLSTVPHEWIRQEMGRISTQEAIP